MLRLLAHGLRIDFAAKVLRQYDIPPNARRGIVAGMPRGLVLLLAERFPWMARHKDLWMD